MQSTVQYKGRVERAIRFIRSSFFAGRQYADLSDLNRQADEWCNGIAANRPCPENRDITVREAFSQEQPHLLPLPQVAYPLTERVPAKVGKTPYVRFDLNDYSVPHTKVQRVLTVVADPDTVRIVDGTEVVAEHARSYDKGAQIEDPAHVQALVDVKRAGRQHRSADRLTMAVPSARDLLQQAANRGSGTLRVVTSQLLGLLDRYGAAELDIAIREALGRGVPHPNAVRHVLDRRRELRNEPLPVAIDLPDHVKTRETIVTPHRLETYDKLLGSTIEDSSDE